MSLNQLNLTVKCDLGEPARIAEEIENFGLARSWPAESIFNINLALDELVTNVILYGFPADTEKKDIRIDLTKEDDVIRVIMEDEGVEFNPFSEVSEPSIDDSLEDRAIGGLGVFFVKSLTDDAWYERIDNKNRITLVIRSAV